MKVKYLLFGLLFLLFTHWVHYLYDEFIKVRYLFHNTIFSVRDLPLKFYEINIGDKREDVERMIGKPFYTSYGYTAYSASGNELFGRNFSVVFQVKYDADTVLEKRVIQDD